MRSSSIVLTPGRQASFRGGRTDASKLPARAMRSISWAVFWADVGITVGVGKITPEAARLLKVTEQALYVGIDKARPGGYLGDISSAIQKHVEAAGFSVIRQFVGHGIGRQMHEDPQVPNFGTPGTPPRLKHGMTLAIEPMVNAGSHEAH